MKTFTSLLAILTVSVVALTGCFDVDRGVSQPTGETYRYICIDGVRYLQYDRGVSVMFNADGTIKTCAVK